MLTLHPTPQARAQVAHDMMELSLGLASPDAKGAAAATAAGDAEAADPAIAAAPKLTDHATRLQLPPLTPPFDRDPSAVVGSIALPVEGEEPGGEAEAGRRVQVLERRTARATQLEVQLTGEAETLVAELTAAILARKASSESSMKGRRQSGGMFSAFRSPSSAKKR